MRKVLSFTLAAALLVSGVYLFAVDGFSGGIIFGKVILASGLLIAVGGWWLWSDFIAPALGRKVED